MIEVDPETYEVRADGELLTCEPARCCRWRSATSCSEGRPRCCRATPCACRRGWPQRAAARHRRPSTLRRPPLAAASSPLDRRRAAVPARPARAGRAARRRRPGARRRPLLRVVAAPRAAVEVRATTPRHARRARLAPRQPPPAGRRSSPAACCIRRDHVIAHMLTDLGADRRGDAARVRPGGRRLWWQPRQHTAVPAITDTITT